MSRVMRVIAIASVCVGLGGVVGGCIGVYGILRFLAASAERPVDLYDIVVMASDGVHDMRVRQLEQELAGTTEESRRAEIRRELDDLKQEADAREQTHRETMEAPRRYAIPFTLAYSTWIVVSALLAFAALCVLCTVARGRCLLAISLALIPLTVLVTCLLCRCIFLPAWCDLLGSILELLGLSRSHPAHIVVAVVSGAAALVYPVVALVLLWRAKARGGAPP